MLKNGKHLGYIPDMHRYISAKNTPASGVLPLPPDVCHHVFCVLCILCLLRIDHLVTRLLCHPCNSRSSFSLPNSLWSFTYAPRWFDTIRRSLQLFLLSGKFLERFYFPDTFRIVALALRFPNFPTPPIATALTCNI